MATLRTGGQPLGASNPAQAAGELLRRFAKSLGKDRRLSVSSNSAVVTLAIQKREAFGQWKTERTVQGPTAIDAIRALAGSPVAMPQAAGPRPKSS